MEGDGEEDFMLVILDELREVKELNEVLLRKVASIERECLERVEVLESKLFDLETAILDKINSSSLTTTTTAGTTPTPKDLIPMNVLKDVFDGSMKEELEKHYVTKPWSALSDELKENMKDALTSSLIASNWKVPSEKIIMNRLKGFYGTRRHSLVVKGDQERLINRKRMMKASQRTFIARQKAITEATKKGTLDPSNREAIEIVKKSIPQCTIYEVPPPRSDEALKEKRLKILEKARLEKKKKKEIINNFVLRNHP